MSNNSKKSTNGTGLGVLMGNTKIILVFMVVMYLLDFLFFDDGTVGILFQGLGQYDVTVPYISDQFGYYFNPMSLAFWILMQFSEALLFLVGFVALSYYFTEDKAKIKNRAELLRNLKIMIIVSLIFGIPSVILDWWLINISLAEMLVADLAAPAQLFFYMVVPLILVFGQEAIMQMSDMIRGSLQRLVDLDMEMADTNGVLSVPVESSASVPVQASIAVTTLNPASIKALYSKGWVFPSAHPGEHFNLASLPNGQFNQTMLDQIQREGWIHVGGSRPVPAQLVG
ncbi:hypothetical protein ACFL0C_00010 [Patescibacteria group bacterium]